MRTLHERGVHERGAAPLILAQFSVYAYCACHYRQPRVLDVEAINGADAMLEVSENTCPDCGQERIVDRWHPGLVAP